MASDFGTMSPSSPDFREVINFYSNPGTQYGNPLNLGIPSQVETLVASVTSGNIVKTTYSTMTGQVAVKVLSGGLLTNQGTLYSTYYDVGSPGVCGTMPQWDGLLCQTFPGANPPSAGDGYPVPTTTTTYNGNLEPQTVAEVVQGVLERTITYVYDLSGRLMATHTVDSTYTGSVPVSDTEPVYSTNSGTQIGLNYVTGDTIVNFTLTVSGTPTSTTGATYDANGRVKSLTDANGKTTTYFYNVDSEVIQTLEPVTGTSAGISVCNIYSGTDALGHSELRPIVTSESVVAGTLCSGASPVTYLAAYDANANAVTLVYPNAMVATTTYNPDDQATQLAYTQGGSGVHSGYASTVMTFAQTYNVFGQVATASSPESNQVYAYDGAGHLIGVGDNFEGSCATRNYSLNSDSDRLGYTSAPTTPVSGSCPTTTGVTPTVSSASTFDISTASNGGTDRIATSTWTTPSGMVTGSYAYDTLGRQTTIPGVDTQAGGTTASPNNVSLTYRSDDLVYALAQGSSCETFSYDPSGNLTATSNYANLSCSGTASTSINDFAGNAAPLWTTTGTSTTAFFDGISSGDALNVLLAGAAPTPCLGISTASCTVNLTDMRGDIVATAALTTGVATVSGYSETTEFGLARSAIAEAAVAPTYGWLGVHEKAANNLSGLVVMGVRVYNPATGLFTSPDPIYGGNDNPYVYPSDPINGFDLTGQQAPPPELIASRAAAARQTAFCKAHPGIQGHSCGGFFHELGGTLSKGLQHTDNALADVANSVSNNRWLNCVFNGVATTLIGLSAKNAAGAVVKFVVTKSGIPLAESTPYGWIGLAALAGLSCAFEGQIADFTE
jgi:RHS repeat-associated protein